MKKMCLVALLLVVTASCDPGAGKTKTPKVISLEKLLVQESPDLVGQWVHRSDGGTMLLVIRNKDGNFTQERRSDDGTIATVTLDVRNVGGQQRFVDRLQPPGMYLVVNRAGDLELRDGRGVLQTMPAAKRKATDVAPDPGA